MGRTIRVVTVVCCWLLSVLPGAGAQQQPDRFESLLASAQDAQARSDFQAAAEYYRQAVSLHPEIPELSANLGLMYYQTGNDEPAIAAFRKALRVKPELFVPNLFLGLENLKLQRYRDAIPYLKKAALARPADVQPQLALAQAYARDEKPRLATSAYTRAAELAPENAEVWYHLGVTYLEQVEANARILLTRHRDSAYVQALMAETFAEQRALIQAGDIYRKLLNGIRLPPGSHANYGFVLLNRHDLAGAERELNAELGLLPGSLPGKLGMARLHLEQGESGRAVQELAEVGRLDDGFLRANIARFTAGLPRPKRDQMQSALDQHLGSGDIAPALVELFRNSASGNVAGAPMSDAAVQPPSGAKANAAKLYAEGKYRQCSDALASRPAQQLLAKDLELYATCSYATGNYARVLPPARKLAANSLTESEGLYWETKAAEKLAGEALSRASGTNSSSPMLHVLLGDVYRQRKSYPDAEQEYRRALALRPEDTGALFGLSLALLSDGQHDEALKVAQAALEKNPDDPEFNAVMGEVLCARREYSAAEPFLKKSLTTKPEFISRVHALLGNVYAKTDRTQEAIAELKLALESDKDGSLHYQIARLYLKVGDRASADQAFAVSKRLQQEGLTRAAVALQQGMQDSESQ